MNTATVQKGPRIELGLSGVLSRDTDNANAGAILKEFDAAKRAEIAKGFVEFCQR